MTNKLSERARAFLAEQRFAVLSTINPDGTPQLTVMWYALDGDEILMNTKADRKKDQNVRRDPRIAICIEDGYNYVTIAGRAQLIDDQAIAQADIRRLAERYHSAEKVEQMMRNLFGKEQRVTIRLAVEQVIEALGDH